MTLSYHRRRGQNRDRATKIVNTHDGYKRCEDDFFVKLVELFDKAHADVLERMNIAKTK